MADGQAADTLIQNIDDSNFSQIFDNKQIDELGYRGYMMTNCWLKNNNF